MTTPSAEQAAGPGTGARRSLFSSAESDALEIQEFQPAYVLSALRTPAYAEAEAHASGRRLTAEDLGHRRARQGLLDDPGRRFSFLMTEAALRWHVGSAEMMREQIGHLLAVNRRPNVEVMIIPWRRPVRVMAGHAFHIYDRAAVVVGTAHTVLRTTAAEDVRTYLALFHRLQEHAAHGAEADAEMRRVRDEYARTADRHG